MIPVILSCTLWIPFQKLLWYSNIELLTISHSSAYSEYEPYCFVETVAEYLMRAQEMIDSTNKADMS